MNLEELKEVVQNFTEEAKQLKIVSGVYSVFREYEGRNGVSLIAIVGEAFIENPNQEKEEERVLDQLLVKYGDLSTENSMVSTYKEYSFSYTGETFKLYDTYTLKMLASGCITYDRYGSLTELRNCIESSEMYSPFVNTTQVEFDNYKTRG